jgi:hypothetical protein
LSPPATLTPTLLCRISIRPQRRMTSAVAAASVVLRVTSASNDTHSKPSAVTQGGGFSRGIEAAIDSKDAFALASKAQYRRPTVADAFTGALPSAYNDRNLVFKTHRKAPGQTLVIIHRAAAVVAAP